MSQSRQSINIWEPSLGDRLGGLHAGVFRALRGGHLHAPGKTGREGGSQGGEWALSVCMAGRQARHRQGVIQWGSGHWGSVCVAGFLFFLSFCSARRRRDAIHPSMCLLSVHIFHMDTPTHPPTTLATMQLTNPTVSFLEGLVKKKKKQTTHPQCPTPMPQTNLEKN